MTRDAGEHGIGGTARFNVIVARKRRQSQDLMDSIERLGGRAVAIPLIDIDLEPSSEGKDCLQNAGTVEVLAATSANALKALAKAMDGAGQEARTRLPRTCYVMGKASAHEAERLGFTPIYFPGVKTGLEFANKLNSILPPTQRIFFPQGNLASQEVAEVLRRAGHDVIPCTLYTTRDAPIDVMAWQRMVSEFGWAFLVLYSPSAVHSFYRQWLAKEALDAFRVVCIGPTTAAACQKLGMKAAGVAPSPTNEAVLGELDRLLNL